MKAAAMRLNVKLNAETPVETQRKIMTEVIRALDEEAQMRNERLVSMAMAVARAERKALSLEDEVRSLQDNVHLLKEVKREIIRTGHL